ncbi:MAG: HTH domain-containing protein [Acidobacteria bacterium]|nr:HTH domain-containing protein [Acidobacteriota bacterium]
MSRLVSQIWGQLQRVTTLQLASELEVARRTVLRDIDALTEAGLPIVVHRGNAGGVELGFDYHSRLVGLAAGEAEALGVILAMPKSLLTSLGIGTAAHLACDKLMESMPQKVRARMQLAQRRFRFPAEADDPLDERLPALAAAVRDSTITRIHAKSDSPRTIHPVALEFKRAGWAVIDALDPKNPIPISQCGDINISARRFAPRAPELD